MAEFDEWKKLNGWDHFFNQLKIMDEIESDARMVGKKCRLAILLFDDRLFAINLGDLLKYPDWFELDTGNVKVLSGPNLNEAGTIKFIHYREGIYKKEGI